MLKQSTYGERLRDKLSAALSPIYLEVKDNSAEHAGHSGHDPKGETHFSVKVVSARFESLSRLERHRLIYALLAEEIKERVHALTLEALAPHEFNQS